MVAETHNNVEGDVSDRSNMSDVPIESAEAGASLPAPEQIRSDAAAAPKRGGGSSKKWLWITLAVVVLIAVIVGVAVGVSNKNAASQAQKDGGQSNVSEPGPEGPGPQEPQEPGDADTFTEPGLRNAELEDVIEYLVNEGVSSREDLMKGGSPQSLAADWLANEDGLNLPVPEENSTTRTGYMYISRYILSLLWYALNGSGWSDQLGFMSDTDICRWYAEGATYYHGHYCLDETGIPAALYLRGSQLEGSLPTEIFKMTSLYLLELNLNSLKGGIHEGLCDLTNLQYLDLAHNEFIGTLPPCLSDMSNLGALMLSDNEFLEQVPDISKLSDLQVLMLDDNRLTGDLTSAFNEMNNLTTLFLDDNEFSGTIDENFMKGLALLERVDVSGNKFEGVFPGHLFDLPKLELLDIHDNLLAGPLPTDIAESEFMRILSFHKNQFSGPLPASLSNLKNVYHLDASENTFTGAIPTELGNMVELRYLFLAANGFDMGSIPDSFANLTDLEEFSLKSTNRNGTIPGFIGDMLNLTLLDLDNNSLEGEIPASVGILNKLRFLLLNNNNGVNGTVPSTFSGLASLHVAFLEGTSLTGDMDVICTLPKVIGRDSENDGNKLIVADCGGEPPEIACQEGCCDICCTDGDETCNGENDAVASLKPEWENLYTRSKYNFGPNTTFYARGYLGD